MEKDQFDLLLELVPQDVLTLFFHRKKTAISSQVDEPFTFLTQLQDYDLITEDLCQEVTNAKSKDSQQKGVHMILNSVEKKGVQSIKTFWKCMFEAHMLQKYPFLCSLMKRLLEDCHGEPDAKKVTRSEHKKCRNKRKRCTDESEEEEPHTSSVSRSTRKRANRISPIKGEEPEDRLETLSVNCGDKEGTLAVDKLARGEECILSEGRWFTPHKFERFSGKESSKNWKQSIRYQNTPLQKLLNEGRLQCPRTYRRYNQKKTRLASSRVEERSSLQSVSNVKLEEEDIKQEEEEEEEDNSESADLSKFQDFALPVCCGSASGTLYKSRFAGSCSKSIRTEEHWFSPEEFVMQEKTLTDRHWKKDILCHGKTLNYLVKKKILYIHSLLCFCRLCRPENQDHDNDDVCYICNTWGNLVCCDGCPRAFHPDCHTPTIQEEETEDTWCCTFCVMKTNQGRRILNLSEALRSPVSGNCRRCEYLLMRLYKEDTRRVFTDDPTATVKEYSRIISKPMWLNRVKTKLQNKEYKTLAGFVNDIILIFNNCKIFNKDNEFGKMGARLRKMFVEDLHTVFTIQ